MTGTARAAQAGKPECPINPDQAGINEIGSATRRPELTLGNPSMILRFRLIRHMNVGIDKLSQS
jgi:hypothetical protein